MTIATIDDVPFVLIASKQIRRICNKGKIKPFLLTKIQINAIVHKICRLMSGNRLNYGLLKRRTSNSISSQIHRESIKKVNNMSKLRSIELRK